LTSPKVCKLFKVEVNGDWYSGQSRPSSDDLTRLTRDCVNLVGLQHENLCPLIAACVDGISFQQHDQHRPLTGPRSLQLVYLASSNDENLWGFLSRCRLNQVCASFLYRHGSCLICRVLHDAKLTNASDGLKISEDSSRAYEMKRKFSHRTAK
jgi:hypothetical protein